MELSRSDLLPRKPTVKSLAGWQAPAIAPSDLPRVHAKGTELPLIGCYHPMTKLSAVPETENFCPTWNSPHGRSLLWTHHQPDQGFVLVWGTFCTTYTVPLSLHGGETYIAVWRPSPLAMPSSPFLPYRYFLQWISCISSSVLASAWDQRTWTDTIPYSQNYGKYPFLIIELERLMYIHCFDLPLDLQSGEKEKILNRKEILRWPKPTIPLYRLGKEGLGKFF